MLSNVLLLEASEKLLRRNVYNLGTLLHAVAIFCDPLVHRQLVDKEKLLCRIQKDQDFSSHLVYIRKKFYGKWMAIT